MLLLSIDEAKIEMSNIDAFFSFGMQEIDINLENENHFNEYSEDNDIVILLSSLIEEWCCMMGIYGKKDCWRAFVDISCQNKFQNVGKRETKEWWKIMRNICLTVSVQCVPLGKIRSMMVGYPKKQWQAKFLKMVKSDDLKFWGVYAHSPPRGKITENLVAPIVQKEVITLD